jgi:AcrR family transcriptional regulator
MQKRSLETQERILTAANTLFSSNGYEKTGVSQICQAAGVSKGAFYHHFPSKHSVFMTLLQQWLGELDRSFLAIESTSEDVLTAIHDMAASTDRIFHESQGQLSLFLEFWEKSIRDEKVWEETKEPFLKYFRYFSLLIKKGIDQGAIAPVDPASAARALIGLAIGTILQGMLYPQDTNWNEEMQKGIDLLLKGLQNE